MGLINNTTLSGIVDRIAAQAGHYKQALTSGARNGDPLYVRIHTGVPNDGDFGVENDLISSANGIDNNTISGSMFDDIYTTFINDLETHGTNNNAVNFNSWLNISGINVHEDFEDVYFQTKNSHLDARNVFFPEANILTATYGATGSGTGTFTDGTQIGTGSGAVSSTNHAAAKMVLVPVNDTTSDIQINVRLTEENLAGGTNSAFTNILIPSGSTSGTHFSVNNVISGGHDYLDVTNIVAAGGASGNHFRVYALRERDVRL